MAFSNTVRTGDDKLAATSKMTNEKTRSFGALWSNSTSDAQSKLNPLGVSYGNGSTDWGSRNIWSHGNGISTRTPTRESSRDGLGYVGQEEQSKGSLQQSGSFGIDDKWYRDRNTPASRAQSQVEGSDRQTMGQQRSASYATLPPSSSNAVASRPPAISLNTTSSVTSGHRSTNSSIAARGYEPAPTVYTKHDRQQDPNARLFRDSAAVGSWSAVSPTDSRRPFPPSSRTVSQPMSRNNSQQPTFTSTERPTFTQPDYHGGQQRTTQNGARAPSVSSQNNPQYNFATDLNFDQLNTHLGQLSMNGDSRPQTSYRSSDASFSLPYSAGISPLTRSSIGGAQASFGAAEEHDDFEGEDHLYSGFPNPLSPLNTSVSGQAYGGRFPPTPTSAELRPSHPYVNGQVANRGYDMSNGRKPSSDWQSLSNGVGTTQLSRPSLATADQPAFMTPQMQQLFAAQLRQTYGSMFNPYAMPNAMHVNGMTPFFPMMPMAFPTVDPQTPTQQATAGEDIQSTLLHDFKNNAKSKRYELRDIYDHIAEFSGDQHGSRFIQTKLETANSDEKNRVFTEIEENALQLMTDVFGNYVIQKFFEHGDQLHKKALANKMKGHVLSLTNQMYGCRVVQKALDHVLVEQQGQLVRELEHHVLQCVKDQNGNHVIQKAIERCQPSTIEFIINSFQHSVQQLSVNSYGCRVIQRCLEHCDKGAKAMIMAELMDGIQGMITDQYGNYVVQHVVERDDGEGRQNVLNIVMRGLEMYSKHKFASNVVEKCLEWADDLWRRNVLCKLSSDERRGPDGEGILVGMIKDNYGNYVIRKFIPSAIHRLEESSDSRGQKNSWIRSIPKTTSPSSTISSLPSRKPSARAAASRFSPSSARWSASPALAATWLRRVCCTDTRPQDLPLRPSTPRLPISLVCPRRLSEAITDRRMRSPVRR